MSEISIIVPVYNVEPYLRRCVDSILHQTFTDFELILVDDGSPDGCPAICDEYAKKDARVHVIHQENGGLSAARNSGMEIAAGHYVLFCDSDDYVNENWCQALIDAARTKTNHYMFGRIVPMTEGEPKKEIPLQGPSDHEEPIACFFSRHTHNAIGFAWNVLYDRDVIEKLHLRFRKDVIIEDLPFCLEYLKETKALTYCPDAHYFYMQRKEATLSRKYHQDGFRKWQEKYAMLQRFVDQNLPKAEQGKSRKLLADYYLYFFLDALNQTFDSRSSLSWRQKMCYNQKAVHTPEFQQCIALADGAGENPQYLALLKKGNYYAAYLYSCAAKIKTRLKR